MPKKEVLSWYNFRGLISMGLDKALLDFTR